MLNSSSVRSLNSLMPRNGDRQQRGSSKSILALSTDDFPLIDQKLAFAHVTPMALFLTGTKTALLTGMVVASGSMTQALQDLQDAEEPGAGAIDLFPLLFVCFAPHCNPPCLPPLPFLLELKIGMSVITADGRTGRVAKRSVQGIVVSCTVDMDRYNTQYKKIICRSIGVLYVSGIIITTTHSGASEVFYEEQLYANHPELMEILAQSDWTGFPQKVALLLHFFSLSHTLFFIYVLVIPGKSKGGRGVQQERGHGVLVTVSHICTRKSRGRKKVGRHFLPRDVLLV